MAKDIIEIDVNTGDGVKSMKTLRKEFQDLQTELDGLTPGTQKYIDTLKRLGSVKDEIGDLKNEIAAFAGNDAKVAAFGNVISGVASGFQAAQGAAALFGAESEDLQKSLLKVQAAMAFTEGIKGIFAMQDSLKAASNVAKGLITQLIGVETYTKIVTVATRAWNAVLNANPIGLLITSITALIGVYYLLDKAFEDNKTEAEKLEQAYNDLVEANKEQQRQIDNEITALSGLKENEEEIIKLKEKKIKLTIQEAKVGLEAALAMAKQQQEELGFLDNITASLADAMGKEEVRGALQKKNASESLKLAKERFEQLEKANAELSQFENEQEQKRIDKQVDANKKAKEAADKLHAEYLAMNKARREAMEASIEQSNEINRKLLKERQDEEDRIAQEQADKEFALLEEQLKKKKELEEKYKKDKEASDAAQLEAERKSVEALQGLAQGLFAFRLAASKGNAAEELKIKKQMFQVDKAFNIARAIQDGIRSVQAALTIPPPGGQILAGVNAAIAAGNVAKIAATQFEGGEVSAAAPIFGGNAAFTQTPNISGGTQQSNVTQLNADGTVANGNKTAAPVKAYVVETEVSATQKKVAKLSNQSKIG